MSAFIPAELAPCLDDISRQAFATLADMYPVTASADSLVSSAVASRISIRGEQDAESDLWIRADEPFAEAFTQRLFATLTTHVSEDEVIDAIKELANTVGGNLKGLVDAATTLSIPTAVLSPQTLKQTNVIAKFAYHFEGAGECVVELCESSANY
ncbi:MAG: chemotaxis protein CheX [Janthinobacterium lividum]